MKIFLDDQIDADRKDWIPEGWVGARNFAEFKEVFEEALARGEKIEALDFDNDLGEGEMEGWEIARWVTENHPEIFKENPELKAHSQNLGGGRKGIDFYWEHGQKHWRELIESKERTHPWGEGEMKK